MCPTYRLAEKVAQQQQHHVLSISMAGPLRCPEHFHTHSWSSHCNTTLYTLFASLTRNRGETSLALTRGSLLFLPKPDHLPHSTAKLWNWSSPLDPKTKSCGEHFTERIPVVVEERVAPKQKKNRTNRRSSSSPV